LTRNCCIGRKIVDHVLFVTPPPPFTPHHSGEPAEVVNAITACVQQGMQVPRFMLALVSRVMQLLRYFHFSANAGNALGVVRAEMPDEVKVFVFF
jgi:hypothetical protein